MSKGEWGACIVVGSTVLLVSMIFKLIPLTLFERVFPFVKRVNEDKEETVKLMEKLKQLKRRKDDDDYRADAKDIENNF